MTPNPSIAAIARSVCFALLGALSISACASTPNPAVDATAQPVGQAQVPRSVIEDQSQLKMLDPSRLASNFVDRVIHDLPVDQHLRLLRELDPEQLKAHLDDPARRLSFWINIYNGYTQHLLKQDSSLYLKKRSAFFGKPQIPIAGFVVSMEDIEHGVLRRGATIWTLGHLRYLAFRKPFIQQFAVDQVDFRIHFALNCGAISCPPVMVYQADMLDRQLDLISRNYLRAVSRYDADQNRVWVPVLLRWFSADFGSTDDKRRILTRHGVLPPGAEPDLKYLPYDWTLQPRNYAAYGLQPVADPDDHRHPPAGR